MAAFQRMIDDCVRDGLFRATGKNATGDQLYELTEKGEARVQEMMRERGVDPAKVKGMSFPEYAAAMGLAPGPRPMPDARWLEIEAAAVNVLGAEPADWRILPGDYVAAGDYTNEGEPDILINVEQAEAPGDVCRLIAAVPELVAEVRRLRALTDARRG